MKPLPPRSLAFMALAALWSLHAHGQNAADPPAATAPTFEIADIHPAAYSFFSTYFHTGMPGGNRYILRQATLLNMIVTAYGVEPNGVIGGPSWLDFDRFEVNAKIPAGTKQETAQLMLRALLADRFKLVVQTDVKPLPARLLTVSKGGAKMKPAADTSVEPGCQFQRPDAAPQPNTMPTSYSFSCHNMSMAKYVDEIRRYGAPQNVPRPIIDSTGLQGAWDFEVVYPMKTQPGMFGIDIAGGMEKLGLNIDVGIAPQPAVVVDSVKEFPTPNSPLLAKAMPPPPAPEFDVAVVKPSQPGDRNMRMRWMPNGEVIITGATQQELISEAWDISGAMISPIPDFLGKNHWDITGKANPDAFPKTSNGAPLVSYDDIKLMLRALLEERFQLKAHTADMPVYAYVLLAASPKMKKADPTERTSCKEGPGPDGKDFRTTNPTRSRLVTCQNVTMDQFAAQIEPFALDYVKTPVLNSTHLDGAYDFTINFSSSREARAVASTPAATPGAPAGGEAQAGETQVSEPTGAISLPDEISKQLGLKLELQKRPVPVLVLDHIEEKPTEN